ncbi:MAG: hypothetical protein E6Q97_12425 [Desulfurellales bacterium]|nr:MAG: hypothetical protein E6Q97_12425 [Desulfurellales bacterium]
MSSIFVDAHRITGELCVVSMASDAHGRVRPNSLCHGGVSANWMMAVEGYPLMTSLRIYPKPR